MYEASEHAINGARQGARERERGRERMNMNYATSSSALAARRGGAVTAARAGSRVQASRRPVVALSASAPEQETIVKKLKGKVISTKMDKTLVVRVTRTVAHPKYGKRMKKTKNFYAHDEDNTANEGDIVVVEASRPMSKTKRWKLKEVVEQAAVAK